MVNEFQFEMQTKFNPKTPKRKEPKFEGVNIKKFLLEPRKNFVLHPAYL
jgi:hypothetical protein